jgi:hypothetical protein
MPKPIINGTLLPIKQPSEYNYDSKSGLSRVDRWESAGEPGLYGLATQLSALRISYNFVPSVGKSVLVATATGPDNGQPEVTTDTWQIVANEIQKSLFEHPKSMAIEAAASGSLGRIRKNLERYNNEEELVALSGPAIAAGGTILFDLLKLGTTHYPIGQYVIRHTTNVSDSYAVNVADTNVGKIYTTAQLVGSPTAELTNPNNWVFPIPPRLVYKLQNIPAPAAATGFTWGWRKLPSTEGTAANGRIDINTEYWLEQWSTNYIYTSAT